MNEHEFYVHWLGAGLLTGLGAAWLLIGARRYKQAVSWLFGLVLAALIVDVTCHLLPHALAGFIYGSQHYYTPRNLWSKN